VNAAIDAKQVREHLVWTAYQFPASLPSSTFTPPQVRKLPISMHGSSSDAQIEKNRGF
jgi:hypothetical protein